VRVLVTGAAGQIGSVLCSGLFYFSVMAWSKWKWGPAR